MASKANERANRQLKDAERRARRKLARLKARGIRTGGIDPIKPVDESDTRAVKSQVSKLERFISRKNRYVAGYDGTPLSYDKVRKLRQTERAWNVEQAKRWQSIADKPFITGAPDRMTVAEQREIGRLEGRLADLERHADLSNVKSNKELDRKISNMRRQMTKKYKRERYKTLKDNMVTAAQRIGDPDLEQQVKDLSQDELAELHERSDFIEFLFFRYENMEGYLGDAKLEATETLVDTTGVKEEIERIKAKRDLQRAKDKRKRQPMTKRGKAKRKKR